MGLMLAATTVFRVDTGSFLAIVITAAIAGTLAAVAGGRNIFIPVVVIELGLGIVIGPQVLGLAEVNAFTKFFADLGLGMLFFFAGYEIDIARIRGDPLRLGVLGWFLSLAIAYGLGGVLAALGVVLSLVFVGSALATTAIGTLLPVLSDTGELGTPFGTYLLAAGAAGEFGPILLVTLVLSTQSPVHNALILVAFVALAVVVAIAAVRSSHRTLPLFERTIEKSSQLAVRWIVVLVFALALLASKLGLDLLLGGFAAGLIARQVMQKSEVPAFDSKLTAVAFGVFVPFFFVVSGMRLDVNALFAGPSGLEKLALFFVLFLVVRGTPRDAALPVCSSPAPGPDGAGVVLGHAAPARGRHHDAGRRRGAHAALHRRCARRGGSPVHPCRPAPRAAHATQVRRCRAAGRDRAGRGRLARATRRPIVIAITLAIS